VADARRDVVAGESCTLRTGDWVPRH
jgi:hypothetical protein